MFIPVKNTKIYEQVVQQIKSMIIDGTLKKGDKLPTERDLAEQLQVSRPTVREAMRALEVVGVIESRQGAGNYIRESFENSLFEPLSMMFMLQESNPQDILELRQVLELETAVLAAGRISDEELRILKDIIDEMKVCNNEETNVELDKKFHYTVAKASRNFLIISVLQVISQLIDEFIKDSRRKILSKEENRTRLNAQHEILFEALRNKDPLAAYGAIKEHFKLIEEYFDV